jgi:hypothetical protein
MPVFIFTTQLFGGLVPGLAPAAQVFGKILSIGQASSQHMGVQ